MIDAFFITMFVFVFGYIIYYNVDQITKYRKK
jgi:hypothetical protein